VSEALSRAVFTQLRNTSPEGVAYALSAPVTELPSFWTFENR
jgi:hypothetical protein